MRLEHTTDQWQSNIGTREWVAEISAPIWMPGQRSGRQAVAGARLTEAQADVETVRWGLAGAVRETYWRTWQAAELLKAAEARIARTRALLASAEKLVKAKEIRELDARTVAGEVLADSQILARRRGDHETAVAALAELTGLDPALLRDLEAPVPVPPPPHLVASLEESRPDLKALRSRLDGGQANFDLQEARAIPNPELAVSMKRVSADYGRSYDDEVILGVKLPIPVVDRNQREVMTATAELSKSRAEYLLATNRAKRELTQAESGWRSSWQQWRDASEGLQLASDNMALFEKGFGLGQISSGDLIEEKRRWGEALESERSAAAAVVIAKAAWEQAAGTGATGTAPANGPDRTTP